MKRSPERRKIVADTKHVEVRQGVKLQYVEQGDPSGVPVLLLHGLSDSWHSFERVLPHLPGSIRAFVLTLRGHGDSSRPAAGYRPRDLAADVEAFIGALHLEAVVLAGHSFSSLIARRVAIDHPERIRELVLISPFLTMKDHPVVLEVREAASKLTDPVDPGFVREFQESTLAQPVPRAFFDTIVQESLKVPSRVWKALIAGGLEDDSSEELHQIRVPTLIVWGDRDATCPRSDQEALLAAIAYSRLVVYRGAGHALHWEQPERFAADLVAFVETVVK